MKRYKVDYNKLIECMKKATNRPSVSQMCGYMGIAHSTINRARTEGTVTSKTVEKLKQYGINYEDYKETAATVKITAPETQADNDYSEISIAISEGIKDGLADLVSTLVKGTEADPNKPIVWHLTLEPTHVRFYTNDKRYPALTGKNTQLVNVVNLMRDISKDAMNRYGVETVFMTN